MNYKSEIVLLAAAIGVGESNRVLCPACDGGSTHEASLSITREESGALVWQCFRASCELRGTTDRTGSLIQRPTQELKKPRAVFAGRTQALSKGQLDRIQELWGITDPEHWYWTNDYGGRVAMSIRSPKYLHRGWLLRDIRGTAKVKALTYTEPNEEGLSWYKTSPNAPTVLVEDIPSSVRVSRYMNAVALLGTGIGVDRAIEIGEYSTKPVILALDQDATSLAFKWANRWGLLWGDVIVLPLSKDFKNMTEDELRSTLNGYTN